MTSSRMTSDKIPEKTLSSEIIYKGKAFSLYSDIVLLPDGRNAKKDIVNYPEAVAILAFQGDKIILERQYRYSVKNFLYEIPAGKIDNPEENPIDAAKRELLEETGFVSDKLTYLFSYFPAVGYSTEKIHLFKAENLKLEKQHLDEDEFIEVLFFKIEDVVDMIKNGEIMDAKTILGVLYYINFFYKK
ncbi:MAG: NUDIX hydrolase [Brevinematales bacterium]|nr:NUDIX hydrolase [Brevinematales bacterium]